MLRDAARIEPRVYQDRRPNGNVVIGRHCLCASSHLLELLRSRQVVKILKYGVSEIVDDDARSVRRDQICRNRPSQGDGWRSAGGGLEQDEAERIAA